MMKALCARRASSRAATCRACSRCPRWPSAARCCCTTIHPGCSSRRMRISWWPRGCTTAASVSASSTTMRASCTSWSRYRRRASPCRSSRRTSRMRSVPTGPIAAKLARYEDRPAQREMASAIATLYNEGGIASARSGHRRGEVARLSRFPRCAGRPRMASAPSCRRTRSICRSSSSARICRSCATRSPISRCASRCSRDGETISACIASSRHRVPRPDSSPTAWPNELEEIRAWSERTEDGSLADLAVPPQVRAVGRGGGGVGPLPAPQVLLSSTSAFSSRHGAWRRRRT